MLGQVRRVLLHVDHGSSLYERVVGTVFGRVQGEPLIGEELSREIVAVSYPEDAPVEFQVDPQVQVLPGVVRWRGGPGLGHFVSLQENALRDARVL